MVESSKAYVQPFTCECRSAIRVVRLVLAALSALGTGDAGAITRRLTPGTILVEEFYATRSQAAAACERFRSAHGWTGQILTCAESPTLFQAGWGPKFPLDETNTNNLLYLGRFNIKSCDASRTLEPQTGSCTPPPRNLGSTCPDRESRDSATEDPPFSPVRQRGIILGWQGSGIWQLDARGRTRILNRSGSIVLGNPIAIAIGNKIESATDLSLPGGLGFTRFYGSEHLTGMPAPFVKWSHSFSRRLLISGLDDSVAAVRANGRVLAFTPTGQGYAAEPGVRDTLVELRDGFDRRSGWIYTAIDAGAVEHYGPDGELLAVEGLAGSRITLEYDPTLAPGERLLSATDGYGRTLSFTYDGDGNLSTVVSPDGRAVRYAADGLGNLASVTYPDDDSDPANDPRITYLYNESPYNGGADLPHALTGVVHATGSRFATFRYDAQGRAVSTEHAGGAGRVELAYIGTYEGATATDERGTQRTFPHATVAGVVRPTGASQPGGAGCAAASSSIAYDAVGNIVAQSDFNGHRRCFAYDPVRDLEIVRIEGLAAGVGCPADVAASAPAEGQIKTRTLWHPTWRLPTGEASPLKLTAWVYNGQPDPSNGNQPANCAPAAATVGDGLPIPVLCKLIEQATTDENGAQGFAASPDGPPRVWQYTYDAEGKLLAMDGPRNDVADVTLYEYWPADATCPGSGVGVDKGCRGQLSRIVDALGHATTFLEYDAMGRPLSTKDPNDVTRRFTYDARGRLLSLSVGSTTSRYGYDARGLLTRVTSPDGSTLDYLYDDAERLVGIRDAAGNNVTYTLDAGGNPIAESTTDPAGALHRRIAREYDALSRLQKTIEGVTP